MHGLGYFPPQQLLFLLLIQLNLIKKKSIEINNKLDFKKFKYIYQYSTIVH